VRESTLWLFLASVLVLMAVGWTLRRGHRQRAGRTCRAGQRAAPRPRGPRTPQDCAACRAQCPALVPPRSRRAHDRADCPVLAGCNPKRPSSILEEWAAGIDAVPARPPPTIVWIVRVCSSYLPSDAGSLGDYAGRRDRSANSGTGEPFAARTPPAPLGKRRRSPGATTRNGFPAVPRPGATTR